MTPVETNTSQNGGDELLHWPEVKRKVALSRGTVFNLRVKGLFPSPIRVGPNRVAWKASEIAAWVDAQPRADNQGQADG